MAWPLRQAALRSGCDSDGQRGGSGLPHRGGPHAADLDLAVRLRNDLPKRCSGLLIGSGDGLFADEVSKARVGGRRITVLAPWGGLARALHGLADEVVYFEGPLSVEVA